MMLRKAMMDDLDGLVELYDNTIGRERNARKHIRRYLVKGNVRVIENMSMYGAYFVDVNRLKLRFKKGSLPYRVVWLDQVMVFPRVQGAGYGRVLMEDLIERYGHMEIRLFCEHKLVGFYEKFEFEAVHELRHNGIEQVIMVRKSGRKSI